LGNVQVTYAADADFTEARFNAATLQNGSIPFGSDTYQWGPQECLARTNWGFSGNLNTAWTVTYTFSGTIPAGTIALDVQGLGRRDPDPGVPPGAYISVATVNQNGTFIGDYINGNNWGATQFTGGVGTFSMQNSLSGPGGQDPWWNTGLGLVRIDDPISSLTVHIQQTAGDGVGVNIGAITPTPGSAALLGLGGLVAGRRRRR
jgi:MYXO-CTERM domain-containing protein